MTADAQRLLDEALALPTDTRIRICEALLESIEQSASGTVDEAWAHVAVERLKAHEAHGGKTYSLEEVEARWQARLAAR